MMEILDLRRGSVSTLITISVFFELFAFCSQARVATLKTMLIDRLQPFVLGDKEGFKASAVREANTLAHAAFGEAMLHTIGCGPGPAPKP